MGLYDGVIRKNPAKCKFYEGDMLPLTFSAGLTALAT
jgi:hypothetical protein